MSEDDRTDRVSEETLNGDRVDHNGTDGTGVGDAEQQSDMGRDEEAKAESMPLEDLARELGERQEKEEKDDDLDEAFEPVDVDHVDTDELWEEMFEDDPADSVGGGEPPGVVGEEAGGVASETANGSAASAVDTDDWATAASEHTVSKRQYCQQCPHFSEPPEATCTHEGTKIVEVVTMDQFCVRNCPMVDDK